MPDASNTNQRTGYIAVYQDRYMQSRLTPSSDVFDTREEALAAADLIRKTRRFNIFIAKIEMEVEPAHTWDAAPGVADRMINAAFRAAFVGEVA